MKLSSQANGFRQLALEHSSRQRTPSGLGSRCCWLWTSALVPSHHNPHTQGVTSRLGNMGRWRSASYSGGLAPSPAH